MRDWLTSATNPATMRRAAFTSLLVGFILTAINHGAALLAGDLTRERLCQIFLTFLVPYSVSTISSVSTRHEIDSERLRARTRESAVCAEIDAAL